jgi:hypothetical protein
MILALVILGVASVGFYFQDRSHRTTLNNVIGGYENSLAWERTRVDNLIVQVQVNSQGLKHYPTFGPAEEPAETWGGTDETGLVDWQLDHAPTDDDFIQVADL